MTGHTIPSLLRPLALTFLALPLVIGTVAHASEDNDRIAKAEKRIDRYVGKMEKELKLSPEQSARIKEILKKDLDTEPAGMWGHGKGHDTGDRKDGKACGRHGKTAAMGLVGHPDEMTKQLRSERVDTAALNRAMEARLEALRAHRARAVAKFAEVHAVLTPEQRAKAAERLEKRSQKMKKECRN